MLTIRSLRSQSSLPSPTAVILLLASLFVLATYPAVAVTAKSCERSDTDCGDEPKDGDECTYTDSTGQDVDGTVVVSGGNHAACNYSISGVVGGWAGDELRFQPDAHLVIRPDFAGQIDDPAPSKSDLMRRIRKLERELAELKKLVRETR